MAASVTPDRLDFYMTSNPGLELNLGPLCTDEEWEARVYVALARARRSKNASELLDDASRSAERRDPDAFEEIQAAAAVAERSLADAIEEAEVRDTSADDQAWLADAWRAEVKAWSPVVRAARVAAAVAVSAPDVDSTQADDMRHHARAAAELAAEIATRDSAAAADCLRQLREKQARGESSSLFDLHVGNLLWKGSAV